MKLSVVVPVFNETKTIEAIIKRINEVPVEKEIIVVDDGSTDGTRDILKNKFSYENNIRLIFHAANSGKGQAVRTGIQEAKGDYLIIQDADLEYSPSDYLPLLKTIQDSGVDVVYGSRFLGKKKVTSGWHRAVNGCLTSLTNVLYGSKLTDMETCYKLFKTSFLKQLQLESHGFEIEVELTAKILKSRAAIREIPISYHGRSFHDGKKIGWRDGVRAVQRLFYYRFCK